MAGLDLKMFVCAVESVVTYRDLASELVCGQGCYRNGADRFVVCVQSNLLYERGMPKRNPNGWRVYVSMGY
jgi:hypothetical protein